MDNLKIIVLLWFLGVGSAGATAMVLPGQLTPNDLLWLSDATTAESEVGALLSRPFNGSMSTGLGSKVALPANWSANIPRATLAASAANVLKRAGGYGLAAYAVYQVVSPLIGLAEDGKVTTTAATCYANSWVYYNPGEAQAAGECYTTVASACSATVATRNAYYPSQPMTYSYSTGLNCQASGGGVIAVVLTYNRASETVEPTEADLAARIQASAAADKALLDAALADSVAKSYSNDMVKIVPTNTPATITAAPVTAPEETVSQSTAPNPDGSTTTTTKKVTTTATPTVTGTTAGDAAVTWKTSDVETTTATNNTTNVTTTTTTTINNGTTTTKEETDLCKLNPTAAACQPLGEQPSADAVTVGTKEVGVGITPPASVAGSCPAPVALTIHPPFMAAQTINLSWATVCQYVSMLRYILIAIAWMSALWIVSGSIRSK